MLDRCYGLKKAARVNLSRLIAPPVLTTARFREYSSSSSEPKNVGILGGGITGLVSAYYLSQSNPNIKVTIYESGERLGGWLHSNKVEMDDGHIIFEGGPRSLRPAGNGVLTARLVSDLDLEDETIFTLKTAPAATNRFLYYPDHLVRMPQPIKKLGVLGNARMVADTIISEEVFQGVVYPALMEPFRPTRGLDVSDESVGDFFTRRLGPRIVDQVVSAIVHGIYAGDVYSLSAKSLFPMAWRMEAEHGSMAAGTFKSLTSDSQKVTSRDAIFMKLMSQPYTFDKEFRRKYRKSSVFTFRNGIQQLVDTLKADLEQRSNVEFQLNTTISDVVLQDNGLRLHAQDCEEDEGFDMVHDHIISTLSPQTLNKFIWTPENNVPQTIAPAPTVMTVNLYFRTPNLHPPGFGYLIPLATSMEQNPERALGVVFDNAYSAPLNVDDEDILGPPQDTVTNRGTKVTVMLGGHYWNYWSSYPSKDEGLQMARSVLERHLGITEKPAAHAVNIQEKCIPQYTVGYSDRLQKVHDELLRKYSGRLRVAGNWIRGVGVNDCIRSAWEVTRELADDGKTGLEYVVDEKDWVLVRAKRRKQS